MGSKQPNPSGRYRVSIEWLVIVDPGQDARDACDFVLKHLKAMLEPNAISVKPFRGGKSRG